MEVKPGYKQTDAGVVPDDWQVKELGSLGKRGRPVIKAGPFGSSLTKDTYVSAGYKVYGQEQVIRGDYLYGDYFISKQRYAELKSCAVQAGDILLSLVGTAGRVLILPPDAPEGIINPRLIRFSFDPDMVSAGFFKSVFESDIYQSLLARMAQGGTMGVLNASLLRPILIPLPPLPVQRAIAAALSDTDTLLSGLDSLIAKKRDIKQAAMQQLLTGALRLPGFEGLWEVKRFGELGKCLRGVSYKGDSDLSPHDTDHTIRLLRSNNVQNAAVVTTNLQFVNSRRVSSQQIMHANDILICMANGSKELVGKAGLFNVSDGYAYTFGAFMGCYRTNVELASPAYVFFLFQTGRYRQFISNLLAGSSINNLRPSVIEELEFHIPEIDEQAAIAAVLSDMDAEIVALEQKQSKTRALKQGMMQELLTGRVRLV